MFYVIFFINITAGITFLGVLTFAGVYWLWSSRSISIVFLLYQSLASGLLFVLLFYLIFFYMFSLVCALLFIPLQCFLNVSAALMN